MNKQHYDSILEELFANHPYMLSEYKEYRPKGDRGVRVTLKDGSKYDYDILTHSIRKVNDDRSLTKDEMTDEECRKIFANNLAYHMGERGYTQQTLAETTCISKGSINAYLNCNKTPSITNLKKIAYALDCPVNELLD